MAIKNLLKSGFNPPILVFCQSKERVTDLFKELVTEFKMHIDIISSDRSQPEVLIFLQTNCQIFIRLF